LGAAIWSGRRLNHGQLAAAHASQQSAQRTVNAHARRIARLPDKWDERHVIRTCRPCRDWLATSPTGAPAGGRAGIRKWDRLSSHSLRHIAITMTLDAGVQLRDVQDYARHRYARTTRRYDHSRDSLDRSAAYGVVAYLA
jgi:hypothetical protein